MKMKSLLLIAACLLMAACSLEGPTEVAEKFLTLQSNHDASGIYELVSEADKASKTYADYLAEVNQWKGYGRWQIRNSRWQI